MDCCSEFSDGLRIGAAVTKAAELLSSPSFGEIHIAVIGDYILDRYVFGDVSRISPEAPVPVIKFSGEKLMPGGAGNVAANLLGLGARVSLLGRVGDDECGDALLSLAQIKSAEAAFVSRRESSAVKTRFIGGLRQQMLRLDREDFVEPLPEEIENIIRTLSKLAADGLEYVIISDYGKGFCSAALCEKVISSCRSLDVKVIVDPKDNDWTKYSGAFLITPNLKELSGAVVCKVQNDDEEIVARGAELVKKFGIENLLVTRSEKGATLINEDGFCHIRAGEVEVFDVSGAGDTMAAVTTAFFAAGMPLAESVAAANFASQIVIEKAGTYPITAADMLKKAKREGFSPPVSAKSGVKISQSQKITERAKAASICRGWKNAGERVVFTNGCFDILHPGHTELLAKAKSFGDRLIVGLNSDGSVRRLKGDERPVNREAARAALLAALEATDLIVVFGEDTPAELVRELRPDVIVKGGDYKPDEVAGRQFAGSVEIVPLVEDFSTTALIDKIGGSDTK